MTDAESAVPPGVDPTQVSVARIYDYLLGGTHHFAIDRAAGEQLRSAFPPIHEWAWGNRGFHQRAAHWLAAGPGIDQFLDIGAGLPTQNNTHDVVQSVNPSARVVYIDVDPMVAAHAQELLRNNPRTHFLVADVREPDALLANTDLRAQIDFTKPVGLMMTALLHFVDDDSDPWALIARYRDALPTGSYLALSHATGDRWPDDIIGRIKSVYANANEKPSLRTKAEVERMFDGLDLVAPYTGAEPGVAFGGLWGADDPASADDDASRALYCGVAHKP